MASAVPAAAVIENNVYLPATDAPRDIGGLAEEGSGFEDFPADLRARLAELALI